MALWGGRFTQAADQRFKQFNDSLRFDYRLAEQDIVGSVAWSKALVTVGVLTAEEQAQLEEALNVLLEDVRASAQGMFLMMTNGFGCILGGIVSGKVVEMYTQNGITDWQTVWLIFAGYSVVLAFAFMAMFKYKHVRVPTGTQTVSH